jgi:hypothetical protein
MISKRELEQAANDLLKPYFGFKCDYPILSQYQIKRRKKREVLVGNPEMFRSGDKDDPMPE